MRNWTAALPLACLVAACSTSSGGVPRACVPGEQRSCACPGGGLGAQICLFTAKGYAECMGCTPPNDGPDLSTSAIDADLSAAAVTDLGPPDASISYTVTSLHEIDTNGVGGMFGKGTAVKVAGLIATTQPNYFKSSGGTKCTYQVFVQDPACATAPCGLVAQVRDQPMNGGLCDFANVAMTPLMPVNQGDQLDLQGTVDLFVSSGMRDGGPTVSATQHILVIDSLVDHGAGTLPPPMELTDGSPFVTYGGAGWAMYEGTYVRITPVTVLTIASKDVASPFHFHTTPGNTDWGDDYRAIYNQAATLDSVNSTYTSIAGVVSTLFGGAVLPTLASDFVP